MKIRELLQIAIVLVSVFMMSCGGVDINEKYHMNKPYWDTKDYENALSHIRYPDEGEKRPNLSDPEKAPVFKKLVSKENIDVVVKDSELGTTYKSNFTSNLFDRFRDMMELYGEMDREDKYVYPLEIAKVIDWGMYMQYHYFVIHNQNLKENSDDPDSPNVQSTIDDNIQVLISNYANYLSLVNDESSFSDEAISVYANALEEHFLRVIEDYPEANYKKISNKVEALKEKAEHAEIINALESIEGAIASL